MKSVFSLLALVLATGLLAPFVAGFAGFALPEIFDGTTLLFGFVASLTALLVHHDYAVASRKSARVWTGTGKAEHPLAA